MEGVEPNHYSGLIPISRKEEKFLKIYINGLLVKGFIRASSSKVSYAVLFTLKKDGGLRPCIDFRRMNAIIKLNRYPLPRINKI